MATLSAAAALAYNSAIQSAATGAKLQAGAQAVVNQCGATPKVRFFADTGYTQLLATADLDEVRAENGRVVLGEFTTVAYAPALTAPAAPTANWRSQLCRADNTVVVTDLTVGAADSTADLRLSAPFDPNASLAAGTVEMPVPNEADPTVSDNTLGFTNSTGAQITGHVLHFGRVFKRGAVPANAGPAYTVNGSVLSGVQTTVKNRWPDNSIKFAVIALPARTIDNAASVEIMIGRGGTIPAAPGTPTLASLLSAFPGWDVTYELQMKNLDTGANEGAVETFSFRAYLATNPAFDVWEHGPVVTTIRVGDHITKSQDMGGTAKRLRPCAIISFYHGTGKVKTRAILESCDTMKIGRSRYGLTIRSGTGTPTVVETIADFIQIPFTRRNHVIWTGGAMPIVDCRPNTKYVAETRAIPNFDTSIVITASERNGATTRWNGFESAGRLQWGVTNPPLERYMPGTGGRGEIGIVPEWIAQILHDPTGAAIWWRVAEDYSRLFTMFPWQIREGEAGRLFDRRPFATQDVPAIGRPVSITARYWWRWADGNKFMVDLWGPADEDSRPAFPAVPERNRLNAVSPGPDGLWGWQVNATTGQSYNDDINFDPDRSHAPCPWWPLYILTGDLWCVEQGLFLAAWMSTGYKPIGSLYHGGPATHIRRGGWFSYEWNRHNDQQRGEAWAQRTMMRAGAFAPDGTPEKDYFWRTSQSYLDCMKGILLGPDPDNPTDRGETNGRNGYALNTSWSDRSRAPAPVANPLRVRTGYEFDTALNAPLNETNTSFTEPYYMEMLGVAMDLGYDAQELIDFKAPYWTVFFQQGNTFTDDDRATIVGAYTTATRDDANPINVIYQEWPPAIADAQTDRRTITNFNNNMGGGDNYTIDAMPCAAIIASYAQVPGAQDMWRWYTSNTTARTRSQVTWNGRNVYKRSYVPRPITDPRPPVAATVTVSQAALSLAVGQTVSVTATVRDANGNPIAGRPVYLRLHKVSSVSSPRTVFRTNAQGQVTFQITATAASTQFPMLIMCQGAQARMSCTVA